MARSSFLHLHNFQNQSKPEGSSYCNGRATQEEDKSTKKDKPLAFATFSEQRARLRLDLATDLLSSEREICSGVRPDESSATVTRGGDFAAESEPREPPAAETAGKEEEDLWRLGGWK